MCSQSHVCVLLSHAVLVLVTSPQKPPTTYTWVNDYHIGLAFYGGDLYVGATYTRVYTVI